VAQSVIDLHLAKFEPSQRAALRTTCATVRAALPGADEVIAYGMPTFKVDGRARARWFQVHNSLPTAIGGAGRAEPDWVSGRFSGAVTSIVGSASGINEGTRRSPAKSRSSI
jgi:hypothetical protein